MNDLQPPLWRHLVPKTEMIDGEKYLLAFRSLNKNHNRDFWKIERVEVFIDSDGNSSLLLDDGDEFTDFIFHDAQFYIHLDNG